MHRQPDPPGHEALPAWFARALLVSLVVFATFAITALGLAFGGILRPWTLLPLAVPITGIVGVGLIRHLGPLPASTWSRHLAAVAAVLIALTSSAWNAKHHAEHLVVERDPGVYAATAAWLADEGDLRFRGTDGPFAGEPTLRVSGAGFTDNGAGSLYAQFPHLTATVLALGAWAGDDVMFLVNPLLGGVALLVWFALGTRVGRPWGATAGVALLAISFPFVYFTRDTYSEPVAMVLLPAGLWVLALARDRTSLRLAAFGGLLVGATCMARIDGFVTMVSLAAVLGIELRLALHSGDRRRLLVPAVAGAMASTAAAVGALDVRLLSKSYFNSDLAPRLPTMAFAAIGAGVAAFAVATYLWSGRGPQQPAEQATPMARAAVLALGAGVVVAAAWARFVRPDFDRLRAAMEKPDITLTSLAPETSSISYLWLEWYLGPALVAVGLAMLLVLLWRGTVDQRLRPGLWIASIVLVPTVLYLHSPLITPDHPWAMRRFVAITVPGLTLATGLAVAEMIAAGRGSGWRRWAAPAGGLAVLASAVVGLWSALGPLRDVRVGVLMARRFDEICAVADREEAAILVAPDRLLGFTLPQSLQAWCDVPVAGATDATTPGDVLRLAREWEAEGRQLVLLAASPDGVADGLGEVIRLPGTVMRSPEVTIDRPPRELRGDHRLSHAADGHLPMFLVIVDTA